MQAAWVLVEASLCLHVAQIFVRDFRFRTGNFVRMYHSPTSVGLSVFVQEIFVNGTNVPSIC